MVLGAGESDAEKEPRPSGVECPVQLSQALLDPEVHHRKFYRPHFFFSSVTCRTRYLILELFAYVPGSIVAGSMLRTEITP